MSKGTGLVRYDAMRRAIAAAHKIDEVKDIRDKARALEMYARMANNHEDEELVRKIRIRAERKCGEKIAESEKAKGSAQPGVGRRGASAMPSDDTRALSDYGISYDQSAQWQKLAAVPADLFEEGLAEPNASTASIIRRHELQTEKPVRVDKIDEKALWLWGVLDDFHRLGILDEDAHTIQATMLGHMKASIRDQAPRVIAWLGSWTLMTPSDQLADAIRQVYDINRNVVSIGPEFLANAAMSIIGFDESLHPLGWYGCNLHLRQIARGFCRRHFVPDDAEHLNDIIDLFPETLQDRYPRIPLKDKEPEYVLRDHLSADDRWYNIDRMLRSAAALQKHAQALRTETIEKHGPRPSRAA